MLINAFENRDIAGYDVFAKINKTKVETGIRETEKFIQEIVTLFSLKK
ncbi:MAG: hypothetical protein ACE5WD_04595 [Candidatus Aminicenantia bacterium]